MADKLYCSTVCVTPETRYIVLGQERQRVVGDCGERRNEWISHPSGLTRTHGNLWLKATALVVTQRLLQIHARYLQHFGLCSAHHAQCHDGITVVQ